MDTSIQIIEILSMKIFISCSFNCAQNVDAIFMYTAFKCLIIEAQNKQNIKCGVKYGFSHLKLLLEKHVCILCQKLVLKTMVAK